MAPVSPRKPRLSVVVPTHDTRPLTLACLGSLAAELPEAEVIVVDDASADDTSEAIRERYPAVRILRNHRAEGFSRSANRGLAAAEGKLLLLLNSDTEVAPGAQQALDSLFGRDLHLGIVGAALRFPDGRPQWSGGRFPALLWLFGLASGFATSLGRVPGARALRPVSAAGGGAVDWVTGAAMAFRREVWSEVGPLDEDLGLYSQDLDFCSRARMAGWKVAVAEGFRVLHHQGATIGQGSAAAGRQSPEALWRSLVRWGWKHRGPSWGRRAAWALRAAGRMRLVVRALGGLLRGAEAREAWRRDSLAYREALNGVRKEIRALEAGRRSGMSVAPSSGVGDSEHS